MFIFLRLLIYFGITRAIHSFLFKHIDKHVHMCADSY